MDKKELANWMVLLAERLRMNSQFLVASQIHEIADLMSDGKDVEELLYEVRKSGVDYY